MQDFEYYPEENKNLLEKIWMEIDMINVINIDFLKEEVFKNKRVETSLILERFNQELKKD